MVGASTYKIRNGERDLTQLRISAGNGEIHLQVGRIPKIRMTENHARTGDSGAGLAGSHCSEGIDRLVTEALTPDVTRADHKRTTRLLCQRYAGVVFAGSASQRGLRTFCARAGNWIDDGETAQGRFRGRVGRNEISRLAVDTTLRVASHQRVVLSRDRAAADQRLIPGDHNLCGEWGIGNGRNINAFDVGANAAIRDSCLRGGLGADESRRKDEEAEQNGGTHWLHLNYASKYVISRGAVASFGKSEIHRYFLPITPSHLSVQTQQLVLSARHFSSRGLGTGMSGHRLARFIFCTMFVVVSTLWGAHGQRNDPTEGSRRFMEYCAGCHGDDGKGGSRVVSLATTLSVMTRSDEELARIVHDGTTEGMPPFAQIGDANIRAVVHYLRIIEGKSARTSTPTETAVTGDVNAGRVLYFGKARCSTCHMMKGQGGFIASDLTTYGRSRPADAILQAITTPDTPLVSSSRVVSVMTKTGLKLTGVLRYEDNFSLALQMEDGRYHLLTRSDLIDVHYTDHSLMPRDYGTRLTSKELNDLVSFLIVASRSGRRDR
jgi:cytochrome c oxidase cbb3-type subunit III